MVAILEDLAEGLFGSFLTQRASLSQQALFPWNQKRYCQPKKCRPFIEKVIQRDNFAIS